GRLGARAGRSRGGAQTGSGEPTICRHTCGRSVSLNMVRRFDAPGTDRGSTPCAAAPAGGRCRDGRRVDCPGRAERGPVALESLTLRGQVLFPDGVLRAAEVVIADGRIRTVGAVESAPPEIIAPGFIDLQLNGAYGHDFTTNPETIFQVAAMLPQTGVTAFLP